MRKQILYVLLCILAYEIGYRVIMYLSENIW